MVLLVKKLVEDAVVPEYQTNGSAAMDLSVIEEATLWAKDSRLFRTGIAVQIPHGFFGYIRPRSSLCAKQGIALLSSNLIDSDYRGEILLNMYNTTASTRFIAKYQRVAQMLILPYERVGILLSDALSDTERGNGGFGSTG
jgi:dUTP pyrophosphatase